MWFTRTPNINIHVYLSRNHSFTIHNIHNVAEYLYKGDKVIFHDGHKATTSGYLKQTLEG